MSTDITQPELIGFILRYLDKRGQSEMNVRQMNAVVEAANIIMEELNTPHQESRPNSGLTQWLASDEVGLSSKFMAGVLSGKFLPQNHYPHDPSDFGRCLGMLEACPELAQHLPAMKNYGPVWSGLVDRWKELRELYLEELPSGTAPKTYAAMREIIETAQKEAHA